MARGKKKLTLEEQLEKITTEIENMKNSLKELEQTKKDLEEQIKMNRLLELDELIIKSGRTVEDIIEMLKSKE